MELEKHGHLFLNWKLKDLGVFLGSNFRVQHHPRLSKFCLGLEWRKLEPIHLWSKLIHFLDYKPSGIESINKSRFGGRNKVWAPLWSNCGWNMLKPPSRTLRVTVAEQKRTEAGGPPPVGRREWRPAEYCDTTGRPGGVRQCHCD